MKTQLYKYDEIIGKTITNIDYADDLLILSLGDNEFTVIAEPMYSYIEHPDIFEHDLAQRVDSPHSMEQMGLITVEERDEQLKERDNKEEQKRKQEIKELARLKAKYE